MRIVVLGGQAMVHGFTMAGVEGVEVEPGPAARERFDALTETADVAVILVSRRLFDDLRGPIARLRAQKVLPVVMAVPDRGEDLTPEPPAKLLEEFLGLRV